MDQLVKLDHYQITAEPGRVIFEGFEDMKQSVQKLADHVKEVEVTEETVQQSKKLLAEINKAMAVVNDERKMSKAIVLEPYTQVELQIKEIEAILKEPVQIVRDQVKQLEEQERAEKEEDIHEIFNKRLNAYPSLMEYLDFGDFITPQHLNKSTSMKKVEEEMTAFLEKVNSDFNVMKSQDDSSDLLYEYKNTFDLGRTMQSVAQEKERKERIARQLEEAKKPRELQKEKEEKKAHFVIRGDKNIQLVQLLLDKADMTYQIIHE